MANLKQGEGESPTVWSPPESSMAAGGALPKIKLGQFSQPIGTPNILVRIKKSWVGHFYQEHLKQIPLVRGLVIWLWRNLYPIHTTIGVYLGPRIARRWRPLVKLGDHVKTSQIPTIKVCDAARVDTPVPKVFPAEDQAHLLPPSDHYMFPSVYVAEISKALIYGGSNLVFTHEAVICHDLYDFKHDYTSEELHGRHVIDTKRMRMRLLRHDSAPEHMTVAASFVDACAPNYAHWLTEVLPRIAAFCTVAQYKNVPIIVNDGLHCNIMESLALIVGPEREIITLPVGRGVQVERLYVTSVAGYVPFEQRDKSLTGHSHGLFNPFAIDLVRKQVFAYVEKILPLHSPEKVYLVRNSGVRKLTNAPVVEKHFLSNGYVYVNPEKLSFTQQAVLFANAKEVASPTGAALANVIWLKPGGRTIVFMSKHKCMIYRYWLNIFAPFDTDVTYILGDIDANSHLGIHGDFSLKEKNIKAAISSKGIDK